MATCNSTCVSKLRKPRLRLHVVLRLKAIEPPITLTFERSKQSVADTCEVFWSARKRLRFSPKLQRLADEFIKAHPPMLDGGFVAVHWRHGDVALREPYKYLHSAADYLKFISAALGELQPPQTPLTQGSSSQSGGSGGGGQQQFKALYLLTDNFFAADVANFQRIVKEELGMEVVLFGADNETEKGGGRSDKNWVTTALMDMLIASRASYFMYGKVSYFSR